MKKSDYKNSNKHIFYCDKSDWYTEEENYSRDFSKSLDKIKTFWELIRIEKMEKQDFDFSDFVFPHMMTKIFPLAEVASIPDFWLDKPYIFNGAANFKNAVFLGDVDFKKAKFKQGVVFDGARFDGVGHFYEADFNEGTYFRNIEFKGRELDFRFSKFRENAYFEDCIIPGSYSYRHTDLGNVGFLNVTFEGDVNFIGCHFTDVLNLHWIDLKGRLTLTKCTFENSFNLPKIFPRGFCFNETEFDGSLDLSGKRFMGEVVLEDLKIRNIDFSNSRIKGGLSLISSNLKDIYFRFSEIDGEVILNKLKVRNADLAGVRFSSNVLFKDIFLKGHLAIHEAIFNKNLLFKGLQGLQSSKATFSSLFFNEESQLLFENWKNKGEVLFENIIFSKNASFLNFDFSNTLLLNSEILNAKLSFCRFEKKNGRSVLLNERQANLRMTIDVYRQFKENLRGDGDWEESGDFYWSEMVTRRKLLLERIQRDNNFYLVPRLFVIIFYEIFSGFYQSISRPIISLIALFCISTSFIYMCEPGISLSNSMEITVMTMFPISGKIDYTLLHNSFKLKLILIRILSIIFITFFVLTARARLKQ